MTTPSKKVPEALDQSSGDEQLSENEDDEERHFSMLMESLGASNVFEESLQIKVSHIKSKRRDKSGRRWRASSGGDMLCSIK